MINVVLFVSAALVYAVSTFCYEARLLWRSQRSGRWATPALILGAILHALAIALRWVESGHPPFANLFEALSLYAWGIVVFYLIVERYLRYDALGAFVTPIALAAITLASVLPKDIQPLIPVLRNRWLAIHVTVSFAAYAVFTLAFVTAVVYLLQERELKRKRPDSFYYRLPPLHTVEQMSRRLAAIGLLLLTGSIFSGSLWAEQAWGVPWVWQPQQIMALITWGIYFLYFYARNVAGWRGRRAAGLLVIGFVSVMVTFVGADLMSPSGLHNFIF